jgi:hypothetical protein
MRGQQRGACDGQHLFGHQQFVTRPGPGRHLLRRARVQRGVAAAVREHEGARRHVHMHRHQRVLRRQVRQPRQQPAGGEGGHRSQVHAAVRAPREPGGAGGHRVQRVALQPVEPAGHLACVGCAGGRQCHAMARAAEQRDAEKVLQRRDLARHRALRQRQFVRGAGVALVPGGGIEAAQRLQGRDLARHDMLLPHFRVDGHPPAWPDRDILTAHVLVKTIRLRGQARRPSIGTSSPPPALAVRPPPTPRETRHGQARRLPVGRPAAAR